MLARVIVFNHLMVEQSELATVCFADMQAGAAADVLFWRSNDACGARLGHKEKDHGCVLTDARD